MDLLKCFVDNQKNNWQKKTEGRKHKIRDTEIEEQEAATGIRVKKRCLSSETKPEVGLDIPLPLTIVPAQGAAVWEVALVIGWRTLPPTQEPTGVTDEYQVEEVLPEQAVEVYRQTGRPEALILPHDGGSHEYSADGMDNMQVTSANTSASDSWDFLLDPQLQEQRVTRRHSCDNFT
ncbi:hypothetical protein L873DRAFT_1888714 [Choiromyces venosus 120613-1]|uniref:Uncharacterized protein n=1 Tax=Choiromyces venosus 120613-1 TaxID=1336337 RepID=A0A3N4IZ08_9PEZI|nr:hypothetical protein L873DRAFT_1888714 [Choiromyces venosus 120613-1]